MARKQDRNRAKRVAVDTAAVDSVATTSVNLFADELPIFSFTTHEDGGGTWTIPTDLMQEYHKAVADAQRTVKAILAHLKETGQPIPFPFDNYTPFFTQGEEYAARHVDLRMPALGGAETADVEVDLAQVEYREGGPIFEPVYELTIEPLWVCDLCTGDGLARRYPESRIVAHVNGHHPGEEPAWTQEDINDTSKSFPAYPLPVRNMVGGEGAEDASAVEETATLPTVR